MTHEIDTDGGDVGLGIGVVGKSQQQARLSYTGISDEEELEEIVVSSRNRSEMSSLTASRQFQEIRCRSCVGEMLGGTL